MSPVSRTVAADTPPELATAPGDADAALVSRFCDALWLEDGLSQNTIDAYRRDLTLLARWLRHEGHGELPGVDDSVLSAYFNAVGNVFTAFSARDKNEVDKLTGELKMDALKRKLDKCREAAQKQDDDAWKTLQCDAIGTNG